MGALLGCAFILSVYMLPMHAHRGLPRNHPQTILYRMACTSASCLVAWIPLYLMLKSREATSGHVVCTQEHEGEPPICKGYPPYKGLKVPQLTLQLLGLRLGGFWQAVGLPLALTGLLFLGPLLLAALDWGPGGGLGVLTPRTPGEPLQVWALPLMRNLLVGPITEEFVFRSCMAPLLLLEGFTPKATILLCPLLFGAAHLHHLYELTFFQKIPIKRAAFAVAFQFLYTTIFGWYASFLLLRTGHWVAAVVAHTFCNLMGFPDFGGAAGHRRRWLLAAAFALGIAGFAVGLEPLSRPALYDGGGGRGGGYSRAVMALVGKEGRDA